MTRDQFVLTYTHGLDGNEEVPFHKFVALLEDLVTRGCGGTEALAPDVAAEAITIGTGTGFAVLTPANDADDIVHLPKISEVKLGHKVYGVCTATGCEIRVHPDDDDDVSLNNNHVTVNEAALAAGASFFAMKISETQWILHNYSTAGALTAPTPD